MIEYQKLSVALVKVPPNSVKFNASEELGGGEYKDWYDINTH